MAYHACYIESSPFAPQNCRCQRHCGSSLKPALGHVGHHGVPVHHDARQPCGCRHVEPHARRQRCVIAPRHMSQTFASTQARRCRARCSWSSCRCLASAPVATVCHTHTRHDMLMRHHSVGHVCQWRRQLGRHAGQCGRCAKHHHVRTLGSRQGKVACMTYCYIPSYHCITQVWLTASWTWWCRTAMCA